MILIPTSQIKHMKTWILWSSHDAGTFIIHIENSILILEISNSGGYETLETPDMFLNLSS